MPLLNLFNKNRPAVVLAPLAGVSDIPMRVLCERFGADLTYVEMLSATALSYNSKKTFQMMARGESETCVGVQVTGRTAEETAAAVAILDKQPFETIDINMGCPVKKVVQTGCGSAILRDPERVYETVRRCRAETSKPFSAKIRVGWSREEANPVEVAQAIESAGADWLTIHGRCRSEDYSVAVDLDSIRSVVESVSIPVVGNGNIFSYRDQQAMVGATGVAGVMVSRGALGNPWIFSDLLDEGSQVSLELWRDTILDHLNLQHELYGDAQAAAVRMRKHLLWYLKGWPGAKELRDHINKAESLAQCTIIIKTYAEQLQAMGATHREVQEQSVEGRFEWDPKYDMDRRLDRGVGDDRLSSENPQFL